MTQQSSHHTNRRTWVWIPTNHVQQPGMGGAACFNPVLGRQSQEGVWGMLISQCSPVKRLWLKGQDWETLNVNLCPSHTHEQRVHMNLPTYTWIHSTYTWISRHVHIHTNKKKEVKSNDFEQSQEETCDYKHMRRNSHTTDCSLQSPLTSSSSFPGSPSDWGGRGAAWEIPGWSEDSTKSKVEDSTKLRGQVQESRLQSFQPGSELKCQRILPKTQCMSLTQRDSTLKSKA